MMFDKIINQLLICFCFLMFWEVLKIFDKTFSLVIDNFGVKYIGEEHCLAPPTNGAKILNVLVRKGGGKMLRTHHQVELCWQDGAPFDAIICQEGIKALSASSTYRTAGSTASAHQIKWNKKNS